MPRPPCCRRVSGRPGASLFGPPGEASGDAIAMTVDEFEAIRLADHEGLYHEQAAERMQVSRPTFGRILQAARGKVAEALVGAKWLRIEGGTFDEAREPMSRCPRCARESTGRTDCPHCGPEAQVGGGVGPCWERRRGRVRCRPDAQEAP